MSGVRGEIPTKNPSARLGATPGPRRNGDPWLALISAWWARFRTPLFGGGHFMVGNDDARRRAAKAVWTREARARERAPPPGTPVVPPAPPDIGPRRIPAALIWASNPYRLLLAKLKLVVCLAQAPRRAARDCERRVLGGRRSDGGRARAPHEIL